MLGQHLTVHRIVLIAQRLAVIGFSCAVRGHGNGASGYGQIAKAINDLKALRHGIALYITNGQHKAVFRLTGLQLCARKARSCAVPLGQLTQDDIPHFIRQRYAVVCLLRVARCHDQPAGCHGQLARQRFNLVVIGHVHTKGILDLDRSHVLDPAHLCLRCTVRDL